jgi:hypothetical protein
MQKASRSRVDDAEIAVPVSATEHRPLTPAQNVALTIKIFFVAAAIIGAIWLLDKVAH